MATTNWYAIRDGYIGDITALTPSVNSTPFQERPIRHQSLREWAQTVPGSDTFRRFEIVRTSGGGEVDFMDPTAYEVKEELEVVVAYPTAAHNLYGDEGFDDLEQVMELDANQIRDTVTSASNYQSGQNVCRCIGVSVERDEGVWFLVLSLEVYYYKAQSL